MYSSTNLRLKQALVGTSVGRWLENIREYTAVWKAMGSMPEKGSQIFQDRCGRILLSSLCRPDRMFIDVGAHIGSVISSVQHSVPGVGIVAIEADPQKANWLTKKFPSVQVHNCAVGNSQGEVEFEIDLERPGYSSLSSNLKVQRKVRTIRVAIQRLDELYTGTKPVDVMKIDVEGMELAVLQGSAELIGRCRPTVYFESGPQGGTAYGFTRDQLFEWFSQHDYQIFVPNRVAHEGTPLTVGEFIESHYYPQRTLNYFAVAAERRMEIRDRARMILGVIPNE
jgi:FkbM family methyltransferase